MYKMSLCFKFLYHLIVQYTDADVLHSTVHNWCAKWQIHLQLKDIADEATILNDLHSLCDTTRMTAIASISLLAEQEASVKAKLKTVPLRDTCSYSSKETRPHDKVLSVSEEMVEGLCRLLNDSAEHVRVPSALVLYSIDRQNQKVCVWVIQVSC